MDQDTIAAIATPVGSGGIGIIRISGAKAFGIAQRLFLSGSRDLSKVFDIESVRSHQLKYGHIRDPRTGQIIDEVLLAAMKAPHSYTRQDVVEIQSHSGPVVLGKLIELTLDSGARLAEPGEFTRRAFLNGRIDLTQAEAVADMINAKTEQSLQIAAGQLSGVMKSTITGFIETLSTMLADLQAVIEFPEDVEDQLDRHRLARQVRSHIITPVEKLIAQYQSGHILRDGLRMDIVGRPNVGKSSLLNQLLQKDKAIVTPYPGTTRDLVEDFFNIRGIPIIITDTAGLHATRDPVEIIGIQKTQQNIARSDIVLFVIDAVEPFIQADHAVYQQITTKRIILVVNKIDLLSGTQPVFIPESYAHLPMVRVSALTREGVEHLEDAVAQHCLHGMSIHSGQTIIPNLRQKFALDLALGALQRLEAGLSQKILEELIVSDMQEALGALNQIIGAKIEGDILDQIFSRFCIGK